MIGDMLVHYFVLILLQITIFPDCAHRMNYESTELKPEVLSSFEIMTFDTLSAIAEFEIRLLAEPALTRDELLQGVATMTASINPVDADILDYSAIFNEDDTDLLSATQFSNFPASIISKFCGTVLGPWASALGCRLNAGYLDDIAQIAKVRGEFRRMFILMQNLAAIAIKNTKPMQKEGEERSTEHTPEINVTVFLVPTLVDAKEL
ncbi:hypothetical protein EON65_26970 [archaeon]|nr:MAG: hypothetical protein EON65_26970 [archaeon]